MAIETTYKCDKCDHTQDKSEQMWTIGVGFTSVVRGHMTIAEANKKLWCRKCMEKAGFVPTPNVPKEEQPKQVTIEDLISDIVEDAIANYEP